MIIKAMFEGANRVEGSLQKLMALIICPVGKTVHDSINALSFEDEVRQISTSIAAFIRKVDYDMDFEKQLNFYVECRYVCGSALARCCSRGDSRAFSNLDSVKEMLVTCAANLAMRTLRVVNGSHTRKTAAFVRVRTVLQRGLRVRLTGSVGLCGVLLHHDSLHG